MKKKHIYLSTSTIKKNPETFVSHIEVDSQKLEIIVCVHSLFGCPQHSAIV